MQDVTNTNRSSILNSLQQRNVKEKEQFYKLIKSRKINEELT